MNAHRISGAERKTDDIENPIAVVIDEFRRTAVRGRAVELVLAGASVDRNPVLPVIRCEHGAANDILHFLPETTGKELFRSESVALIDKNRKRRKLIGLIAGEGEIGTAVSVQIANEHHIAGRHRIAMWCAEQSQDKYERRHNTYDSTHRTLVPAAKLHACGPSPTETCAMSAETSVMAKPAYAHSLSRAGTGARSARMPRNFAQESSTRKYEGKPRCVKACATCGKRNCAYAVKAICRQNSAVTIQ